MKIVDTCKHCEGGQIGMMVCPSCWGTTVSPQALRAVKLKLGCVREAYAAKRAHNKTLRGRARGLGGHELSRIGRIGSALRAELDRIEAEVAKNKALARVVGASVRD